MITFAAAVGSANAVDDVAVGDVVPTPGRCGPLFHYNSCEHGKYCNEANGFCGATAAHRDAQDSSTYDANDAAVRVALTGDVVPTPGRCGPLFHMNTCMNDYYCNEANGWCGTSDVYRDAQSSTAYDGRCIHKDCSDWDCALWCECFEGTSCAASILFFNRSLPRLLTRVSIFALSSPSSSCRDQGFGLHRQQLRRRRGSVRLPRLVATQRRDLRRRRNDRRPVLG